MIRALDHRAAGRLAAFAVAGLALTGCNAMERLSRVGEEPPQTAIENPAATTGDQSANLPMPRPESAQPQEPNSLWRAGSRAFFKDQRASDIGDILTVVIDIDDDAAINNSTERTRDASESAGLGGFLGFESNLDAVLPSDVDNENLIDAESDSLASGSGSIQRGEEINLRVAAMVTQVLPNGNLVIGGRQEVRVNYENRELKVMGIIRPEDITARNTIDYEQIAEARISYGGRGQISDVQQPRYGQQVFDIIWPF